MVAVVEIIMECLYNIGGELRSVIIIINNNFRIIC